MRPQSPPAITNPTGLQHAWFVKAGPGGELVNVLALKGTWRISVADQSLHRDCPGEDIVAADSHIWRRQEGSLIDQLLRPGEKTLPKPNGDLLVIGAARSERGAQRDWLAGVRVGELQRIVHLHGPRQYERSVWSGWKLTKAQPVDRIQLDASQEFGGSICPEETTHGPILASHETAPSGSGWLPDSSDMARLSRPQRHQAASHLRSLRSLRAPAIQDPQKPHHTPHERAASVGLGPVPRWSKLRTQWLGDLTKRVTPEGRPCLPGDLDFRFFQVAPPSSQREGYFQGDETLVLLGLLAQGRFEAPLPGLKPVVEVRFAGGHVDYALPRLDTVLVDLDRVRLGLVWRYAWPASLPIEALALENLRFAA